jgi:hypothetical protein
MDRPKPGTVNTGSHTFKLSFQTCVTCHSNPETLLANFHVKYDAELAKLKSALLAKPAYFALNSKGAVVVVAYDSTTGKPFPPDPGSADLTDVWYQSRIDFPLKYSQAYWNYLLVSGDEGRGVHNPLYVMALIQNSIEALK